MIVFYSWYSSYVAICENSQFAVSGLWLARSTNTLAWPERPEMPSALNLMPPTLIVPKESIVTKGAANVCTTNRLQQLYNMTLYVGKFWHTPTDHPCLNVGWLSYGMSLL